VIPASSVDIPLPLTHTSVASLTQYEPFMVGGNGLALLAAWVYW
jgi:hypothetical protein